MIDVLDPRLESLVVEQVRNPLMQGRKITCPKCEVAQDILRFTPLQTSEKYADQVIVPLKCKLCNHVFALRP